MADLEKGQGGQTPVASAVGTAYATSVGSLDPPPAILQATTVATPPSLPCTSRSLHVLFAGREEWVPAGAAAHHHHPADRAARRPAHEERTTKRGGVSE